MAEQNAEYGGHRARAQQLRRSALALVCLVAACLTPATGRAQLFFEDAILRVQQQELLERSRRNPADYDAAYAYVTVSDRLGDHEAAIGSLERLLSYNPRLVRAKYELGKLYYRMGSHDAAVRYLREAQQSPDIEPSIAARVDALYPDALKNQSQSRWSGFFQIGARYQSNASFRPWGGLVRLSGEDLLVARVDRRRADGSVFGLMTLSNDYDLQNQRGDVLETRFLGYGSLQAQRSGFDFGYAEASFGYRFGLPDLIDGASIKPYVVGQTSALRQERAPYISSGGGGVSMRLPVTASLTLEPGIEGRAISVAGRDAFTTATQDSGALVSGYLGANLKLTHDLDLEFKAIGIRAESSRSWQSFSKAGATVALNIAFDPPSELIPFKWKLSPFIGAASVEFDRPNVFVDPRVTRRDTEMRTGLVFEAPLTPRLGVSVTAQYDRIWSNLPNYRYSDVSVLGGPTARF